MCAGSERNVYPFVDEDACSRTAHSVHRVRDQRQQRTIPHVALADLNHVNAGASRCRDAPNECVVGALTQALAVGDHADDRMHARSYSSAARLLSERT